MPNVSVRIDDERREELDELADNARLSRAEYIRDALRVREEYYEIREKYNELQDEHELLRSNNEELQDEYAELHEEYDELQSEYEEVKQELERVHREKRQILEQREENTELVKYVEEERSLTRQKAEAGIATRAKWWLFGMER
ncbi:ribbon-helix-helix protein, CopG family [Haladaptatus pallidirubidus]|uniref:Ribbon-helix-helix protein CopG domain-containing protein n=1 Tax=Haladaptatus pallidirubidus TaxID=1008152 RepID=A0AAV3UIV1_9EURY|nr:ribbon-helix-helix protein, CopG family [Haladaptatus pallidirubidus]